MLVAFICFKNVFAWVSKGFYHDVVKALHWNLYIYMMMYPNVIIKNIFYFSFVYAKRLLSVTGMLKKTLKNPAQRKYNGCSTVVKNNLSAILFLVMNFII